LQQSTQTAKRVQQANANALLYALLLLSCIANGQTNLRVVKANSVNAVLTEGKEHKVNWTISPGVKPDVYTVLECPTPPQITLQTDVDAITVKLKPGHSVDFVVLLNGKDSCYTRFTCLPQKSAAALVPELHDTIPFVLTEQSNIKLKVRFDNKDTLFLKFDSGATGFLLTRDVIKNQLHLSNLSGHSFAMGTLFWNNEQVYPTEVSGQGTVGRFGWDVFDGKIVEIDYDKGLFIVHSRLKKPDNGYGKFKMEYALGLFCIQGHLKVKGKKYKSRFMLDTGYQRTILLDTGLVHSQNYPVAEAEVLLKTTLLNGRGQPVPVVTINNEALCLGKVSMQNIPVQLLAGENPAGFTTHILGNEVLKRFNAIFDFQNNVLYLKPNSLYNLPYTEQKRG